MHGKLSWTDDGPFGAAQCCASCRARAGCTAWSWSTTATNGTKHPCWLKNSTAVHYAGDAARVSGFTVPVYPPPPAPGPAPTPAPTKGCTPPHHTLPFCNASMAPTDRAKLLAKLLTVPELIGMMQGDQPAVDRLGIPAYHYGSLQTFCAYDKRPAKNSLGPTPKSGYPDPPFASLAHLPARAYRYPRCVHG